jgi:hypothetical protein
MLCGPTAGRSSSRRSHGFATYHGGEREKATEEAVGVREMKRGSDREREKLGRRGQTSF